MGRRHTTMGSARIAACGLILAVGAPALALHSPSSAAAGKDTRTSPTKQTAITKKTAATKTAATKTAATKRPTTARPATGAVTTTGVRPATSSTVAPAATTVTPADLSRLTGRLAVGVFGGPTLVSWSANFGDSFKRAARGVDLALAGEVNPSALAFSQKGNPQYDLLLVTGANAAAIKATKDAYEPIDATKLSRSSRIFKDLVVKDAAGSWVAVPVFVTVYGLIVNPQFVRTEQIESWADMADRAYKGKVLLNSPFFWSTTDITMFSLANGGTKTNLEPAFDLLKRVIPNVKTTITSLADAAAQIRNEEVDFAPFYFSQYSQLIDQGLQVKWVVPKEGGMNSPLYLVMPKGAKNPANALAFIDFVLQAQQQEAVQAQSSYIPVVDDATLIDKVKERSGFATAAEVIKRTVLPDFDYLAAHQQAHIRRIEDLLAK